MASSGVSVCDQFKVGLCKNDDLLPTAGMASCVQFYDTEEELAACPAQLASSVVRGTSGSSTCTSGYAAGATLSDSATLDYQKDVGWCSSDLDEYPSGLGDADFFSLEQCWDACVADFGLGEVHNVEYDCRRPLDGNISESDCWCYCESSCQCMVRSCRKIDASVTVLSATLTGRPCLFLQHKLPE